MGTNNFNRRVVGVDIDGFIAKKPPKEMNMDFARYEPIPEMIEKINQLFLRGDIVIYHTARVGRFYEVTYAWLRANGCLFHALRMDKLPATFYLDDKNATIEEIL